MASLDCGGTMLKKKILEFALTNWKAILIVLLLLVVALKTRYDYHVMENAYQTQVQSSQAQIEGLKEIHKQEIEEKQLLMESFLESIAAIEEEYERTVAELEEERHRKTREYARKFSEDKKGLITDIETTLGLEYVSP
jgi:capsular polysaccharide biosynthesis protein